jgi:hypothetical protein
MIRHRAEVFFYMTAQGRIGDILSHFLLLFTSICEQMLTLGRDDTSE